ncbi:gluconokinase [Janibacter anophelis]|uniref:gluconokinase n=1 Tax=Janibacter anophelis TaxID=319054 RepID=UPI00082AE48B|nr:gluconokinase [Janibacter anophelis]
MTTHVVVMGVSGSGKTTVAQGVVARTGWVFAEADEFHPRANIDKMSQGIPLTDEDRWPWLHDLAGWMAAHAAKGEDTVITCSALKRSYRDVLRADVAALGGAHRVVFAHLDGAAEVIAARLEGRKGHFMPPSLLQSQIDTLEALDIDEDAVVLDLTAAPDVLIDRVMAHLGD